jgi:hypothetical protein
MNLHLLNPANPLRRSEPDELYAEEYAAAVELGFQASLFPFEEFLTGDFRVRPSLRPGQRILYRGWMLTPQQYSRLHADIVATGAAMVTSPEQYERSHHLPKWYAQLREFTPETCFFQESDDVATRLRELSWKGCFLKDYVKSLSIEDGSMVRDLGRIPEVIAKMRTYRAGKLKAACARAKSRTSCLGRKSDISFLKVVPFAGRVECPMWFARLLSASTVLSSQWTLSSVVTESFALSNWAMDKFQIVRNGLLRSCWMS